LYRHKLDKKYPFLDARGYDYEDMDDFRKYSEAARRGGMPAVKGFSYDNAYFFLHSSVRVQNQLCYIFIHMLKDKGNIHFKGLMFDDFSTAYRYAYAHGCHITKKQSIEVDLTDLIAGEVDDIDMFVDSIDYSSGLRGANNHTRMFRRFSGHGD